MSTFAEDLAAWIDRHIEVARNDGWQLAEDIWARGVPKIRTHDRYPGRSQFKNSSDVWDYVLTVDSKPECWEALLVMARHDPAVFVAFAQDSKYTLSPRVTALVIAAEMRL